MSGFRPRIRPLYSAAAYIPTVAAAAPDVDATVFDFSASEPPFAGNLSLFLLGFAVFLSEISVVAAVANNPGVAGLCCCSPLLLLAPLLLMSYVT